MVSGNDMRKRLALSLAASAPLQAEQPMKRDASEVIAALREAETYFEERADAEYFTDSSAPVGNEEMRLLGIVREAIATLPAAEPADAGRDVEWMHDETRAPWVRNSLKHRITEMRAAAKRCRSAFEKEWMGIPSNYLADAYDEVVAVLEKRLAALASQQAVKP